MIVEWIVSSCAVIFLVVVIRFVFRKKMQPCIRYALWFVVVLRLVIPISFSATTISVLNLLDQQEVKSDTEGLAEKQPIKNESDENQDQEFIRETGSEEDFEGENDIIREKTMPQDISWETSRDIFQEIPQEISQAESGRLSIGRVFQIVWLCGVVLCGGILLAVNLDYDRRLRRSRKRISSEMLLRETELPVYAVEMIQTPCMFGLFHPAIYVTEKVAEEEETFAFVLCHENIHYKHCDNWWAFARNLCLCLHWYNPLVWLAAYLSRQDCELACDEKALEMLGVQKRVDYGRALLELSIGKFSGMNGWRISTTMGGSKRQLSERLQMIVDAPKKILGIRILLFISMVFVLAIGFTGKNGQSVAAANQDGNVVQENNENAMQPHGLPAEENASVEQLDGNLSEASGQQDELQLEGANEQMQEDGRYLIEGADQIRPVSGNGKNLVLDLNFDGYDDLCLPGQYAGDENMPYYCMIWNPQIHEYEKSVMLYNVDIDKENEWVVSRMKEGDGQYSTTYYRYDAENKLHMVRYLEENFSQDGDFVKWDLTYVEEEDSIYMLPAIVDENDFHRTLIAMAKQALEELYQWTGEKVDTACFEVSNMGSVFFGMTAEDIRHSRTFYDRSFGADTAYNLSDYEKSISSMYLPSGRSVWYSPVLWRILPKEMDQMTDEEIIIWYLEKNPMVKNSKVKSIEKRYEDTWTVQTENGKWFEVVYDVTLKEIGSVYGPYPDYPMH